MSTCVSTLGCSRKFSHRLGSPTQSGVKQQQKAFEMADIWNKYADTAARKHGKPGRDLRPKSVTIDAHSHIAVPRAAEFIKPHLDVSTIPLAHFASAETKAINAKQAADIRGCMTGYDERPAIMDGMGVDVQLMMPPPPQCYHTIALEYAVQAGAHHQRGCCRICRATRIASSRVAPSRCRTAARRRKSSSAA